MTAPRLLGRLLGKTDRGRKVVVLVYSEFGRRVHANASDGTKASWKSL